MQIDLNEIILRFFRDDIGGILVTGAGGDILYSDKKSAFILQGKTNWKAACPPPRIGQKNESWDLVDSSSDKTYMAVTSTFAEAGETLQIHHLIDTSLYTSLYRDISNYSRILQEEKDHDGLTGLYNKGKFLAMKQSLFMKQDSIAIYNMDLNYLKYTNDNFGHDAGDRLIKKAAASLRMIEARNIMAFRVGGDEFITVGLHLSREEAEKVRAQWEKGLAELNQADDGILCEIACGMVYGEKGYDLDALLKQADDLMYEHKKNIKRFSFPREEGNR